jgi:acyl-CoA dehydrogenase
VSSTVDIPHRPADPETIAQLRATTRAFIEAELEPLAATVEDDDAVPDSVRGRLAELGYFGLTVPVEYGGLGLGAEAYCAVVEEFGRTQSGFFAQIDDNNGMGSHLLLAAGSEQMKRRWLPEIASGRAIVSFALTEPEAGSDAASIRTLARPHADGYVLNGRKHFISNAGIADIFFVIARTRPVSEADGKITAFVLERGLPGFTVGRRQAMMGLRGGSQHELLFDDCRVPASARLGDEGDGFRTTTTALSLGRLSVGAWSLGAASRALELGIAYARDRVQFGKPIGQFQGVQWLIADSATELEAARALLAQVARRVDAGVARRREASMAKLFATEVAGRIADSMLQVHGGSGYTKDMPLERIYRDLRVQRIIEGTSEIQRMIIATSLLREAGMSRTDA